GQTFLELVNERICAGDLTGERLSEFHGVERPETVGAEDLIGKTCRNVILIGSERCPTRTRRAKNDVICTERSWLQNNLRTIGEFPFSDADSFLGRGFCNDAGRRQWIQ